MEPSTDELSRSCPRCGARWPASMQFCGSCSAALAAVANRHRDGELRLLTIVFCDLVGSTERSTRARPRRPTQPHPPLSAGLPRRGRAPRRSHRQLHRRRRPGRLRHALGPRGLHPACGRCRPGHGGGHRPTHLARRPSAGRPRRRAHRFGRGQPDGQRSRPLSSWTSPGEAANTAARLQSQAAPGGVLISAAAAQAVWGHFTLEPVGELDLKGLPEPLSAYEVRGHTGAVDRLSARVVTGLAPFVGRDHELEAVVERAVAADAGSPQTVVIVGEAGIGKSRLLREAQGRWHPWPAPAPSSCAASRTAPARPSVPSSRCWTTWPTSRAPPSPRQWSWSRCSNPTPAARPPTSAAVAPSPSSRTGSASRPAISWWPWWWRTSTGSTRRRWRSSPPSRRPTADARLAVLATARPTWLSTWPPSADVTIVTLDPLDDDAIGDLLASLGVPDLARVRRLVDRAEGVPLYLEEIAGLAGRGEAVDPGQVPLTIAELLSARLEATGDSGLASDCSVLGTDIDSNVAATVLELDHDQLCARLDELVAGGIMRHHEGRGYGFRHGLLRDAAYSMLLRSDRTRLHAAAAEALDQLDPDGRREEIARHWEGAGRPREATVAWQRAGELATDRSAFVEAGSYYEAARSHPAHAPRRSRSPRPGAAPAAQRNHHLVPPLGWRGARDPGPQRPARAAVRPGPERHRHRGQGCVSW